MGKQYVRGHVTSKEEKHFKDHEELKRHTDYARGILRTGKIKTAKGVKTGVTWKFSHCLLSTKEIKNLITELSGV